MINFLFWVAMGAVLVLGYEDYKVRRELRRFRKELEDRSDFPVEKEDTNG